MPRTSKCRPQEDVITYIRNVRSTQYRTRFHSCFETSLKEPPTARNFDYCVRIIKIPLNPEVRNVTLSPVAGISQYLEGSRAPLRLLTFTMGSNPLHGKRLRDIKISKYSNINARTVGAPLVAFTMAALLFVYTRSSIYAAKRNAQNHRIADGVSNV